MYNCPVCSTEFDQVAKLPSVGDLCPRCGVGLARNKNKEYIVPNKLIDQDGFAQAYIDIRNPMGGAFLNPAPNPVIMRKVKGDGPVEEWPIHYRVKYSGLITDGRLLCPECAGFLGTLRMISGVLEPPKCGKFLREQIDGRKGKCKRRTQFTFINDVMAAVPLV